MLSRRPPRSPVGPQGHELMCVADVIIAPGHKLAVHHPTSSHGENARMLGDHGPQLVHTLWPLDRVAQNGKRSPAVASEVADEGLNEGSPLCLFVSLSLSLSLCLSVSLSRCLCLSVCGRWGGVRRGGVGRRGGVL